MHAAAASSEPEGRRHGLLHVYTGSGKGKSTAAMGLAARAAGHGLRVFVVWFLKEKVEGGERAALERAGDVTFECFGRSGHVNPKHPDPADVASARRALARAQEVIAAGKHDLVILDEVNVALQMGLLDLGAVLRALETRPEGIEVVCTGRGAPIELMGIADYVTRMDAIKHPHERGVESRRGIDE
jgi:cob(I)alamin adenosyltransferase